MSRNASGTADSPEVDFREIVTDLLEARFWIVSAPPIRELSRGGSNHLAECGYFHRQNMRCKVSVAAVSMGMVVRFQLALEFVKLLLELL